MPVPAGMTASVERTPELRDRLPVMSHRGRQAPGQVRRAQQRPPSPSARRPASGSDEWFAAAWFKLLARRWRAVAPGDQGSAAAAHRHAAAGPAQRRLGVPQPAGDYAARLIESCGLEGHSRSAARWSRPSMPTSSSTAAHATAAGHRNADRAGSRQTRVGALPASQLERESAHHRRKTA